VPGQVNGLPAGSQLGSQHRVWETACLGVDDDVFSRVERGY
jgi:hypothetical protein